MTDQAREDAMRLADELIESWGDSNPKPGWPGGEDDYSTTDALVMARCLRVVLKERDDFEKAFKTEVRVCSARTEMLDKVKAGLLRAEEALREREERLVGALQLLGKLEYLPYGADVARRFNDEGTAWITDPEVVAECHLNEHVCPCCGWPQLGHPGPGRINGNAENTHEAGCSLDALLHGRPAPRLAGKRDAQVARARAALSPEAKENE